MLVRVTRPWTTELKHLLVVAAPLVLAQLAQNGMSFVDTLMVGRLGTTALAGIALGSTVLSTVYIMSAAVLLSVGPQVAQAVGAQRYDDAGRAARQGLWLALLISLPGILIFTNAEALLRALGMEPTTAAAAGGYLRAIAYGFPAAVGFTAMRGFLEGHGDTRPIMFIALAGVGLNVFVNDTLIFGKYGFPALGLVGTGFATSTVYTFMFLLAAGLVSWRYGRYRVFAGLRTPDLATMAELFRVGWPISLTLGFEVGLFSAAALVMGRFGEAALAGHQIALQSASMSFMVPLGVAIATGVRVGQAAGRNDPVGVRRAGSVGIAVAAAFMVMAATVFWTVPRSVIGLYLRLNDPDNAATIAFAVRFLAVAGLFQVADGIQVAASGALRGLKDTRVPMLLTLVAYWFLGLPVGLVLAFPLGVGPRGLWFGLATALALAAVMLTARFARSTRPAPAAGTSGAPLG